MTALWVTVAVMTGAVVFVVLASLARHRAAPRASTDADIAVYRDQLDEIGRDMSRGLISDREAEGARAEVARRLFAASERSEAPLAVDGPAVRRRRVAAVIALVGVPAIALGAYAALGRPDMPDLPLAARLESRPNVDHVADLVSRVEAALAKNPDDARGWAVVAPIYMQIGRPGDAAEAYANTIRLEGSNAEREANLGEALYANADGVVTADARAAFERSVAFDPPSIKGSLYLARTAEQDGDPAKAMARLKAMLDAAPPQAPYVETVKGELERIAEVPPMALPTDAEASERKTPEERMAMVRAMVDGLGDRLGAQGGDVGEWLRLVKARAVLGDNDKARTTLAAARQKFAGDDRAQMRIEALGLGLGLAGPGA